MIAMMTSNIEKPRSPYPNFFLITLIHPATSNAQRERKIPIGYTKLNLFQALSE
jgi:hypothetical protein